MAEVTELREKTKAKTLKPTEKKKRRQSEFSRKEKLLIAATSIVTLGGIVFCTVMILLMTSIDY